MTAPSALTNAAARSATSAGAIAFVFVGLLIAITISRVIALRFNPIGLYFDEAQYWAWSRALDWGYFTKPPMVAWAIWATTSAFGDAEWAVRLTAPLAHGVTSTAIFMLARSLYGAWPGFWAGFMWLVTPAVWFSSALISTDALLLPFWAASLLCLHRLMTTRAWTWALLTGLGIGFGLMAKYAMLYFPACMALAALWLPSLRVALSGGRGVLIAAISLAVVTPNMLWNLQHDFATISHTVDNGNFGGRLFNFDELLEFIVSQVFLIGPLIFLAFAALLWRAARYASRLDQNDKFLLAFIVPPLAAVTALSFITRANGNWAVAAYVAATILIAGALWRERLGRRWLLAGVVVNIAIGGALMFAAFDTELSGRFRGVRDARGWDRTAQLVAESAATLGPLSAVMVDDRSALYELNYYWGRDGAQASPAPLRMWLLHGDARNAAEAVAPMRTEDGARVLVVHLSEDYHDRVAADFDQFRRVGVISIPLGGGRAREIVLSVGEGFRPVERDAALHARLDPPRSGR